MAPRFGTDGIRGVAGTDLTPELALGLGRAAARLVPGSPFLLGRDTRRSGTMLQAALAAGIAAEGVDVVDVGVIPTPGLAWLAADRGVPAAMVSASHNPFARQRHQAPRARVAPSSPTELEVAIQDELDRLRSRPRLTSRRTPGSTKPGRRTPAACGRRPRRHQRDPSALGDLRRAPRERRRRRRASRPRSRRSTARTAPPAPSRRLCSSASGSATRCSRRQPDGVNINAGCGSTHLRPLQEAVVGSGAALGVALRRRRRPGARRRPHRRGRRRRPAARHVRVRPPRPGPARRRLDRRDGHEQPGPAPGTGRRGASASSRPPSATGTSPTPSRPTACSSAASSPAISSSAATA